jgi:hypothetical protein
MLRKLLLGSIASVGLLSAFAMPSQASAREFHREYRHVHGFRVYYRDPCRPGWVSAGFCVDHRAAERLAESFRCRGFAVSIR